MKNSPITSNNANNTAVTVGTSSTLIIADNSARKGLILVNDGANVVYLTLTHVTAGGVAVANQGIRLNASGGSTQLDLNALWTGAVYGIAVGGSSNVTVCELV